MLDPQLIWTVVIANELSNFLDRWEGSLVFRAVRKNK
jgi:hypothetical protein